jgi:epidermal growth factor receptor substrate 15
LNQTFPPRISGRFGTYLALSVIDLHLIFTRNISDTQKQGNLNINDFALGMYLIQALTSGQLTTVPPSIPKHIYQQICEPTTAGKTSSSPSLLVGKTSEEGPPPLPERLHQPSIQSSRRPAPRKPDRTQSDDWDVSPAERLDADRHFDVLDPDQSGFVEGDIAAKFMLKFKLPPEDLAHIWFVLRATHRQVTGG